MPGIIELSLNYLPWAATAVAVSYATFLTLKTAKGLASDRVNKKVDLDNAKVVHTFDIEDLDKKAVFCRCWKSSKFPYCDGSHNAHNTNTGDNLGPLIIQQK